MPEAEETWETYAPRTAYSVQLPPGWTVSSTEVEPGVAYDHFVAPDFLAIMEVLTLSKEPGEGWLVTVDESTALDLELFEDRAGFEIISIAPLAQSVNLSQFRYEEEGPGTCDTAGYGLHILAADYAYFLALQVCQKAVWKYDANFVARLFDSLEYPGR